MAKVERLELIKMTVLELAIEQEILYDILILLRHDAYFICII